MKHVHAELMMQYAEDAMTTDKPWELWEIGLEGDWLPLDDVDKLWSLEYTYRRKPKTIRIGEYDVPEPYRGEMEKGMHYFIARISRKSGYFKVVWDAFDCEIEYMALGIIHLTQEAAELHGKALASFTEVK